MRKLLSNAGVNAIPGACLPDPHDRSSGISSTCRPKQLMEARSGFLDVLPTHSTPIPSNRRRLLQPGLAGPGDAQAHCRMWLKCQEDLQRVASCRPNKGTQVLECPPYGHHLQAHLKLSGKDCSDCRMRCSYSGTPLPSMMVWQPRCARPCTASRAQSGPFCQSSRPM